LTLPGDTAGDGRAATGVTTFSICTECGELQEPTAPVCPRDGALIALVEGRTNRVRYPLIDTVLDGRYQLVGGLGSGGFGSVYLARHVRLDRLVAVKLIHAQLLDDDDSKVPGRSGIVSGMFLKEARKASLLSSPSIVRILDFGESEGMLYLVMEYVPGRALSEEIRTVGRLPVERALAISRWVCEALAEIHVRRLVHRDLKPHNIILHPGGDDRLTVVDFGLVKDLSTPATMTISTGIAGTPHYMAPEQFPSWVHASTELALEVVGGEVQPRTWPQVGPSADLYALGVLVYEMLTGRAPFDDDNPLHVGLLHCYGEVVPPSALVPGLREVDSFLLRALAKSPDDRPQSAAEFYQVFQDAFLGDSGGSGTAWEDRTSVEIRRDTGQGPAVQGDAGAARVGAGVDPLADTHLPGAPAGPGPAAVGDGGMAWEETIDVDAIDRQADPRRRRRVVAALAAAGAVVLAAGAGVLLAGRGEPGGQQRDPGLAAAHPPEGRQPPEEQAPPPKEVGAPARDESADEGGGGDEVARRAKARAAPRPKKRPRRPKKSKAQKAEAAEEPRDPWQDYLRGKELYRSGKAREAIRLLESARRAAPKKLRAEASFYLGLANDRAGRPARALAAYQDFMKLASGKDRRLKTVLREVARLKAQE